MGKSLASVTGREMPGCYELDACLLSVRRMRDGDAPDPLFPGGSGDVELHPRCRALQRDAAGANPGDPEARGRARRPAAAARAQPDASLRSRTADEAASRADPQRVENRQDASEGIPASRQWA